MAKYRGILNLRGSIGDLTFVNGNVVRKKSSLTKERIMSDPCFEGFRDHMNETPAVAKCVAALRKSVLELSEGVRDGTMYQRLSHVFRQIKDRDMLSGKGKRQVPAALAQDASTAMLLRGFEFNERTPLSRHTHACVVDLNAETGTLTLPLLDVRKQMQFPPGATHVFFRAGWSKVNFETYESWFSASETMILAKNAPVQDVMLVPPEQPLAEGLTVFLLKVSFAQEVNGLFYGLDGGSCLGIVGVNYGCE